MAFIMQRSGDGRVAPVEYLPAKAGTYKIGQAVDFDTAAHQLGNSVTPKYISVADIVISTAGDLLPCIKIISGMVFESELSASGTIYPGNDYFVSADGTKVAPTGTAGQNKFRVEYSAGNLAGDIVRGYFIV